MRSSTLSLCSPSLNKAEEVVVIQLDNVGVLDALLTIISPVLVSDGISVPPLARSLVAMVAQPISSDDAELVVVVLVYCPDSTAQS